MQTRFRNREVCDLKAQSKKYSHLRQKILMTSVRARHWSIVHCLVYLA